MKFKDKLKEQLKGALSEKELMVLPGGFQTIGHAIIIKLNPMLLKYKKLIAKKYLELLPSVKSVFLSSGKITGKFRTPEKVEYLNGEENPIVQHKENHLIYRFDITKIIFSKGNVNERKYLPTLVKKNEIIVDMFAGIGYFSLPIAKHAKPAKIYSIELNPISYRFLIENIRLNSLEDTIIPIQGDCKEEIVKLSKAGIKADRVIMGVFPAPKDYIKEGLTVMKETGTIYHYEGVREKDDYLSLFKEFEEIAKARKLKSKLISKRFVKSYGPNLFHIVIDILVSR